MQVLVVDNYDSFVFNLVQYLGQLGVQAQVWRSDDERVSTPEGVAAVANEFDGILVSPGPGTTHKTPNDYDTHVPLVIRVPRVAPHEVRMRVATADLAPTLASLLGLRQPRRLDGVDRSELVLGSPPR